MNLTRTIKDTQAGLLKKEFSAVELVEKYLGRISYKNETLNAVLTVASENAYAQAKKVDKIVTDLGDKAINDFPLLGVTVLHKDLFLTKGIKTTAASKVLANYTPAYSATVVRRLEKAGAICLGKTNCDAWAHGASGENSDFGPTKNPWNKDYVSGGSSSGSAAAVAAEFSLISTGTDTGGSIRQPANFCGVVGLKPTYGAVPRYGVIAMASSLDSVGHFSQTVEDSKKIFNITAGVDGNDSTLKDIIRQSSIANHQSPIRIGVPKEYFIEGLDREVEKKVSEAIGIFKKNGAEIVEVSLPHTKYAISVYYIVQPAEVSSNLGRYDGIRYGAGREAFGTEAKRRIMLGTYVLSAGYYDAYYLKAMKVRSKIIEDFDHVFGQTGDKVDALIAPVSPTPAFKIGEKTDSPLEMYLADILTVAANLAGIPGISIPFGQNKKNLPLGFQLLGPRFSEPTLFALGEMFERATNFEPKPAPI